MSVSQASNPAALTTAFRQGAEAQKEADAKILDAAAKRWIAASVNTPIDSPARSRAEGLGMAAAAIRRAPTVKEADHAGG